MSAEQLGSIDPTENQLERAAKFLEIVPIALRYLPGYFGENDTLKPPTEAQISMLNTLMLQNGDFSGAAAAELKAVKTAYNIKDNVRNIFGVNGLNQTLLTAEHHGYIGPYLTADPNKVGNTSELTDMQLDIAQGLALGVTVKQIMWLLNKSTKVGYKNTGSIYDATGCYVSHMGLIKWTVQHGRVLPSIVAMQKLNAFIEPAS